MLQPEFFKSGEEDLSLEQQGGTIEERIEALLELSSVNDDGFNPVNFRAAVDHVVEKNQKEKANALLDLLSDKAGEVLQMAYDKGPLEDGDVPSKDGRDELLTVGLMVNVAGQGGDKLNAATMDAAKLLDLVGEPSEKDDDEEDDD
jgi:hypothetical protein